MIDKLSNALDKVMELANKGRKWEDGDQQAFIFNDGVIILSLEDKTFKINVIAGDPTHIDMDLDLLESEDEV